MPKIMIICYTVPEIWRVTDVIVIFHFALFFAPSPHQQSKKSKLKKKKNACRYHHFTFVYQKLWSDDIWFLRYGAQRTDGRTDGCEKWHIGWVPHLKNDSIKETELRNNADFTLPLVKLVVKGTDSLSYLGRLR